MRQSSSALPAGAPEDASLVELIYRNAREDPQAVIFSTRVAEGWQDVTASQLLTEVSRLAKGLIAAGVEAGDRVVVVTPTRYLWVELSFAIWAVGATMVPLPPECAPRKLRRVLRDCRPAAVILEDDRHAQTVADCRADLYDLGKTWRLDTGGPEEIAALGAYMDASAVHLRKSETRPGDPAVLAYPSDWHPHEGPTTRTHGELLAAAASATEHLAAVDPEDGVSTVMYLPLLEPFAHSLLLGCSLVRGRVGLCSGATATLEDWESFHPTVLLATPEELESIHGLTRQRAEQSGYQNLQTFDQAVEIAVRCGATERPGRWLRIRRSMNDWMYAKIRGSLGGRVQVALCTGTPQEWVRRFLTGIGITVVPLSAAVGTGGRRVEEAPALGGAALDPVVRPVEPPEPGMDGEHGVPALPAPPTTGDPITVLERRLCAHPLIEHAVVLSKGWPVPAAVLTLVAEQLEYWRLVNGKPLTASPRELVADPRFRAELQAAVDAANEAVPRDRAVRTFTVLDVPFTRENGYLTPSGQPDRGAVVRGFTAEIDTMYRWHPLREQG